MFQWQTYSVQCVMWDGHMKAWDADSMSLVVSFVPTLEREQAPFASFAASTTSPLVFYSKASTKHISVLDLYTMEYFKMRGSKKQIAALAVHPKEYILASCSLEGEIRLWDYEKQATIATLENSLPPSPSYFLSFNASGTHLFGGTPNGNIIIQDTNSMKSSVTNPPIISKKDLGCAFWYLTFHPRLPLLVGLTKSGEFRSYQVSDDSLTSSKLVDIFNEPERTKSALPMKKLLQPLLVFHYTKNMIGYFDNVPVLDSDSTEKKIPLSVIYQLIDPAFGNMQTVVAPIPTIQPEDISFGGKSVFDFSSDSIYFASGNCINTYSFASNEIAVCLPIEHIKTLWSTLPDSPGKLSPISHDIGFLRPVKILHSSKRSLLAILLEETAHNSTKRGCYFYPTSKKTNPVICTGCDFIFYENDQFVLVLDDMNNSLKLGEISSFPHAAVTVALPTDYGPPQATFFSPLLKNGGSTFLISFQKDNVSTLLLLSRKKKAVEILHTLQLGNSERILDIQWQTQRTSNFNILAVLTNTRLMLVDSNLHVLISLCESFCTTTYNSIMWVGWSLFFTTRTSVKMMTLDGSISNVLSLSDEKSVLCGMLPDRILLATTELNTTTIYARPLALLTPLLLGELAAQPFSGYPDMLFRDKVLQLVTRFDWSNIASSVISKLTDFHFYDIAHCLALHTLSLRQRNEVAMNAHCYTQAFEILAAELKAKQESHPLHGSELFNKFLNLMALCIHHGQYKLAEQCCETIGDPQLSLILYLVTRNKAGLQSLCTSSSTREVSAAVTKFLQFPNLLDTPTVNATLHSHECSEADLLPRTSTKAVAMVNGRAIIFLSTSDCSAWFNMPSQPPPDLATDIESEQSIFAAANSSPGLATPTATSTVTSTQPLVPTCLPPTSISASKRSSASSLMSLITSASSSSTPAPTAISASKRGSSRLLIPPSQLASNVAPSSTSITTSLTPVSTVKTVVPSTNVEEKPCNLTRPAGPISFPSFSFSAPTFAAQGRVLPSISKCNVSPRLNKAEADDIPYCEEFFKEELDKPPVFDRSTLLSQPHSFCSLPLNLKVEPLTLIQPRRAPSSQSVSSSLDKQLHSTVEDTTTRRLEETPHKTPTSKIHPSPLERSVSQYNVGSHNAPSHAHTPLSKPDHKTGHASLRSSSDSVVKREKVTAVTSSLSEKAKTPPPTSPPPSTSPSFPNSTSSTSPPLNDTTSITTTQRPSHHSKPQKAYDRFTLPPQSAETPDTDVRRQTLSRPPSLPPPRPPPRVEEKGVQKETNALLMSPDYLTTCVAVYQGWERKQYSNCIKACDVGLKLLVTACPTEHRDNPDNYPLEVIDAIKLLASYKVACNILQEISDLAPTDPQIPLLKKFVSSLSIQPQHRVECLRQAVESNLNAYNYGIASNAIQGLLALQLGPEEINDLKMKSKKCRENKWVDANIVEYSCLACSTKTCIGAAECNNCKLPIRFCSVTFGPISVTPTPQCSICSSFFSVSTATKCPHCLVGNIVVVKKRGV
ncbi:hypothetical protein Pelo_15630 [Pelomyxa schiedti]|nr:hypothetical protein Pelo_15630 [Pelomyxa schiedti]